MAIPKAVRKLAQQNDQLEQELRAAQEAALSSAGNDTHLDAPATPDAPAAIQVAAVSPDVAQQLARAIADAEQWKDRWQGLKAAHDTTVSELRTQVASLTSQFNQARQAQAPQPAGAMVTDDDVLSALTPEQRDSYDSSFIDVVTRVAQKIAARTTGDISTLNKRFENVENVIVESKQEKFWNAIKNSQTGIPDFQAINAMPEFQEWVNQIEPLTGILRNDIIQQAAKVDFNPYPVIELYRQFANTLPRQTPAPTPAPADPRLRQVVPDSAGSGGTGAPAAPSFTATQVNKFYLDVTKGVYKGKEDEARRIEQSIDAAIRTGNILPG